MSTPISWWFPIGELRDAVNTVAERYPTAEVARSPIGNIIFTTDPTGDDDPPILILGDIDLGPTSTDSWPRVSYWDDTAEAEEE